MRERLVPGSRPIRIRTRQLVALVLSCASVAAAAAVLAQAPAAAPAARPKASKPAETRPAWAELSAEQQQALQPLAPTWQTLSESHKRKWIALVANYRRMSPDERAKLTSRMNEWAALSPQQRAQARLNFGEAKRVPADERKAKWEAYQALSPEEKRKLAAGAPAKTPPTAAAVRPVPPQKMAKVPRARDAKSSPRIVAGPVPDHPAASHPAASHPVAPAPAPQAN